MNVTAERSFAALLRAARRRAGMTQQQLAGQAGISTRAVSDLECGINSALRVRTLTLMADALGLSDDERERWQAVCALQPHNDQRQHVTANPTPQLSRPLTSFVGRDDEVRAVSDLLTWADTRLVTLTGPGGVGKTRLALAVAERVAPVFPDCVHVVNLAPLSEPALVVPTVAQTLGVHVAGIQSVQEAIATWLRHRTVLVVLDNCEHLLEAAPDIATLLTLNHGLTILATSRAPLRVTAEREYQVPPLDVPTGDRRCAQDLSESGAVHLFCDRARAVRPGFCLTDENAAVIASICARLDGLPLAIELAAARLRLLSPQDLLGRLTHSLRLLVDGPRDAPDRQRTLLDTIAWSYNLLSEPEQRLFRQLTIFAGGWTLDASEAVCDADLDVLDGITTLIDHNLVRQEVRRGDESRYSMLETIHEFGRQRLAEHDEFDAVAGRHLTYVAASIERMNAGLGSHDQAIWIERLLPEIDNVRRALAFALERNDGLAALQLVIASEFIWITRCMLREAADWLSRSIAIAGDLPVAIVAGACTALGKYAFETHDYAQAESAFTRAIELYELSANQLGVAQATNGLAWSAIYEGRYQRAEYLEEQVFGIASAVGNRPLMAKAHETLALFMAMTAEYDAAIARCQMGLDLYRADGNSLGACHALVFLGTFALWQGDLERAEQWGKESLAAAPEGWDDFANQLLGYVELDRANYRKAGLLIRKSLTLRDPDQNGMPVAECFEGLAGVAAGLKDATRGATLLGAAEATRERFRTPIPPPRQDRYDRTLAAIKAQLSTQALEAAWNLGRSLSGDDAASFAHEPDSVSASTVTKRHHGVLSAREVDVLRLVANGLSDREIADSLFISRHTVAHHVTSILNKLGVSSRTAAATSAVREHLV